MNKKFDISIFKKLINNNLPGVEYQNKMSPIDDNKKYREPQPNHKVACVMALLHATNDELCITFIKRSSGHPEDKHAGQIGFPGGRKEDIDKTLVDCALRETEEEIGVLAGDIEILGALTPLYVFVSDFLVYPFIGWINHVPLYRKQQSEVAEILEITVSKLFDKDNKMNKKLKLGEGKMMDVYGYKIEEEIIWGATAMIVSEIEKLFELYRKRQKF